MTLIKIIGFFIFIFHLNIAIGISLPILYNLEIIVYRRGPMTPFQAHPFSS